MEKFTDRTESLLGSEKLNKLSSCKAAVLGLGGVGSAAAEGLVRASVGELFLADNAFVKVSNLNRQMIATLEKVGRLKTEAAKERYLSLNPDVKLTLYNEMLTPLSIDAIFDFKPDFIIDAIDNVTAKLAIAARAKEEGIPLYMSMGTGGRMDPSQLRRGFIEDTKGTGCSLARVLRKELKKRGIEKLPVVYSLETPSKAVVDCENGRHPPSSSPFVPPCAGLLLASYAVDDYLK